MHVFILSLTFLCNVSAYAMERNSSFQPASDFLALLKEINPTNLNKPKITVPNPSSRQVLKWTQDDLKNHQNHTLATLAENKETCNACKQCFNAANEILNGQCPECQILRSRSAYKNYTTALSHFIVFLKANTANHNPSIYNPIFKEFFPQWTLTKKEKFYTIFNPTINPENFTRQEIATHEKHPIEAVVNVKDGCRLCEICNEALIKLTKHECPNGCTISNRAHSITHLVRCKNPKRIEYSPMYSLIKKEGNQNALRIILDLMSRKNEPSKVESDDNSTASDDSDFYLSDENLKEKYKAIFAQGKCPKCDKKFTLKKKPFPSLARNHFNTGVCCDGIELLSTIDVFKPLSESDSDNGDERLTNNFCELLPNDDGKDTIMNPTHELKAVVS